jgi:nicotinic acid mononucleotide adenylyltransferase
MKFLKSTLVMTSIASILLMSNAQAVTYKFIAADDSRETKLCVLAGSDEIRKLKQSVRNFPRFNRLSPNVRFVANKVKCNDMFMESFASKYNANNVANYLDRYTYSKNKSIETNVTIKDIASLPKHHDMPDKVITVYVGR